MAQGNPSVAPIERDRQAAARWRWLESTKALQEQAYGFDFAKMRASARLTCDYLTHMVLSAYSELGEILLEFQWKRWTTDQPFFDRDRILEEAVDAAHFIGNVAVAVGCSDEEWERRYRAKQAKNRERMLARYQQRRPRP